MNFDTPIWRLIRSGTVLFLVLLMSGSCWLVQRRQEPSGHPLHALEATAKPAIDPDALTLAPSAVAKITKQEAREINLLRPFSVEPNPTASPFRFTGSELDKERAVSCLASAALYEAGDDPEGERAVVQVVLNRVRHPAYPKSICAVVFQGSERRTGCQFTFTCDGALRRAAQKVAWTKARALALEMLNGRVVAGVGYSTHYHTDWVLPYWSGSLEKVAAVKTHLFFRWGAGWGRPQVFRNYVLDPEPGIVQLAAFSASHNPDHMVPLALTEAAETKLQIGSFQGEIGTGAPAAVKPLSGVRMIAQLAGSNTFIIEFADGIEPTRYLNLARQFCDKLDHCTLMAWSVNRAPTGFPLASGAIASMMFNYIQDEEKGSHQSFWNCAALTPPTNGRCMVRRVPA